MTGNNTSRKSLLKMPKLALVGKEAAGLCLWTTSLPLRLGLASPLLGHTCLHCRRVHVCEASPLSLPACKDSEIHPPSIQYLFKLLITVKRSHKDCHTSFSHLLVHSHSLHSHPTQAHMLHNHNIHPNPSPPVHRQGVRVPRKGAQVSGGRVQEQHDHPLQQQ